MKGICKNIMDTKMKKESIIHIAKILGILTLATIIGCTKEVEETALVERGGLMCEQNSSKGFSGVVISTHENGVREQECPYKNGKKDGIERWWYESGALESEYTYSKGVLNGTYLQWFNNGKPKLVSTYVNGELDGIYKSWNGGHQEKECSYFLGKLVGKYLSWHNGNPHIIANYDENELLHGEYSLWTYYDNFDDEYKYEKGVFEKGRKVGNWIYKDLSGKQVTHAIYESIKKGTEDFRFN